MNTTDFEASSPLDVDTLARLANEYFSAWSGSVAQTPQPELPASAARPPFDVNQIRRVLSRVNAVFSAHNINIASQYLQTSAKIGYVVTDVETSGNAVKDLRDELGEVAGTIRTRILH